MKTSFLLVTAVFLLVMSSYSQQTSTASQKPASDSRRIQFGGSAGLSLSGAIVKYPAYEVSGARPGLGFEIGGFADIPLANKLYSFRPGLSYSLERASAVVEGDRSSIHVSFIKVPLDFIYHSKYMDDRLSFGAGPFLAYNLGGKYNWANTRTQSLSFGSDQGDYGRTYKRVDMGINLLGSYQLNEQILLGAHFDFGLLNMIHTTEDPDEAKKASIHTLNFGITAGYIFGSK
ncbi:MAG TPA: porin family protein [Puia sp.]|nr:porin family protein [Puia sp.]